MASLRILVIAAALARAAPAFADPLDRWSKDIAEASSRFGIPRQWIRRVIRAESDGQTMLAGRAIVSSAGAMGLMQLMPGTWLEMRSMLGLGSDPFDPHDNILAGTAYLRSMYDRFGYPGMFAAYNAGPARYSAFLSGVGRLPAETREYVATIVPDPRLKGSASGPISSKLFALRARTDIKGGARRRAFEPGTGGLFVQMSRLGAI